MISTPQTGIDSILVVGSFLGWPFTAFKVLAAFVTGVIGGTLVNRFGGQDGPTADEGEQGEHWRSTDNRAVAVLRYAVFDILAAIDLWLIVGILLAAAITAAVPPDYLQGMAWTQGIGGMLLVLVIALPLYVCTTSSVPIAASLIAAGMPVGSALVFLMAGPATNVATIGAVYRTLGLRVLLIYLGTVIVSSILFGLTFDFIISQDQTAMDAHEHSERAWWESASALLLIGLMSYLLLRRALGRMQRGAGFSEEEAISALVMQVDGMTCQHCVANVRQALESQERVDKVVIDLSSGRVQVAGEQLRREDLVSAVISAGYRIGSGDGSGRQRFRGA
jgi:copper chaperone CopZ